MANGPDILNWPRGPDLIDSASAFCSADSVASESSGRRGDCILLGLLALGITVPLCDRFNGVFWRGSLRPASWRVCSQIWTRRAWPVPRVFGRHQARLFDLPYPIIPGAIGRWRAQLVRGGQLRLARGQRIDVAHRHGLTEQLAIIRT